MNKPLSISDFEFEVWSDGKDNRFMMRAKRPEGSEGPRYISFYMGDDELKQVAQNHFSFTLDDIIHRLHICGDTLTFYDFEIPMEDCGTMQVPFVKVQFPWYARRILLRIVSRIWKELRANYSEEQKYNIPRVRFSFSEAQARRLEMKYGQATGSVDIQIDERVKERFHHDMKNPDFFDQFQRPFCIARNATYAAWNQTKLTVSSDGPTGYFWQAFYKNKQFYHGAILNHAQENEESRWSVHT